MNIQYLFSKRRYYIIIEKYRKLQIVQKTKQMNFFILI